MKKVLFLQSNKDQTHTFVKYFTKYKPDYELFFDKTSNMVSKHNDFDLIIPCGAASTLIYFMNKGSLKIGKSDFVENNFITYDKIKTLRIVEKLGIPIPRTYTDRKDLDFFPIFFKSLREEVYRERGIINNKQDLDNIKSKTVFFQEFISSQGTYSVGYIADKGKMLTSFTQKEVISYPYHGGSAVVLKRLDDSKLGEYTERIVKEIEYSGWGLAEFKFCEKRNDFIFMEINAKFWASIEFAFINNPFFLKYLFDIEIEKKNVKTAVYLDRWLVSNTKEIFKTIPYMFGAKWLKNRKLSDVLKKRFKKNQNKKSKKA